RVGNDKLAVGAVAHDPHIWTPDLVGDFVQLYQILLADPGAAFEQPGRNPYFDAGFHVLGATKGQALAAGGDITITDRESAGHQHAGLGDAVAVRIARPPGASENRFPFLDFPT